MCGIVGELRFDGSRPDPTLLDRQMRMLAHRGPDGRGTWREGSVALGHLRLAIIDLSEAGAQPMFSDDGRYVLTFNGEIYNFEEIRRTLSDRPYHGYSDTEVILRCIVEKGIDSVRDFEGMFAFALYDRLDSVLWLFRDGFGIKPLYYHRDERRIIFSSEIKPLLLDARTPRKPNWKALREHLLLGYALDPETAFDGILRLSPGSMMRIDSRGASVIDRFWQIEELLDGAGGGIGEELEQSVARHLISDVPTGLFLSAGIDSSLLLASASEAVKRSRFTAFNVGLDRGQTNDDRASVAERSVAKRTSDFYGVPLVKIAASGEQHESIASIVYSLEEPIANPSNALIDQVSRAARADGTIVLLSGHGGDEFFGGYRRHVWARYAALLSVPGFASLSRAAARLTANPVLYRMLTAPRGDLGLISSAALGWDLIVRHNVAPRWFDRAALSEVTSPLEAMLHNWNSVSPLKRLMLLDARTYLTAQNLINMDKSSMRRSVEVRVPFIDRRVAAVGLSAVDRDLVRRGRNKILLRRAAEKTLPSFVLQQPKRGFGPPLQELAGSVEIRALLTDSIARERGLFDSQFIATQLEKVSLLRAAPAEAMQLYSLAVIEAWFRTFIDSSNFVREE